ncbi:MAG: hypothetical protein K6U80_12180 [Firmicutes bacterium]|nr:hypothetical protein [Bacillota bacterium]
MEYFDPKDVTSPREFIEKVEVLYDGGADSFSFAKVQWEGESSFAIRWNVARREWDDPDKKSGNKKCIGMPSSRGNPVWFLLPKEILKEEKELRDSLEPMKRTQPFNKLWLSYYSGLLSEEEINEIQNELKEINFDLILQDKTGTFFASLEDFTNIVFLAIHSTIISSVLEGIAGNATWDTIKLVVISIWSKIKDKTITRLTSSECKKQRITFGVKAILGKNTEFDFRIDGDLTEETALTAVDKIIDFLREQSDNDKNRNRYFVEFNPESRKWEQVDVQKKIREKLDKK